ncbi:5'-nucleotidase [Holothuria leucospilota]|uniref:5'-nucleotidase n=1 Tax=Holothuria leucospilota TaxID=206669 RepID=A0A9Q1BDP1_HOLLE|nr:5'-nucleotidase [Holothuria leucospilota]
MTSVSNFFTLLLVITLWSTCTCYNLTIIHTNDVHARFEQFNRFGSNCSAGDATEGSCFGGVARRATKIKEIRDSYENTLLLDAGDQFQGSQWFVFYSGAATSYFMNQLGYDVMTLGNHEFDLGVEGLIRFLRNVTFPVVSSNINSTLEPELEALFQKSVILNIGGELIGTIGYTTRITPEISKPGRNLVFGDEISSVQTEVDKIIAAGINKIIAVGHAGYEVDLKIAKNTVGIDIIVGGHTDTFLYTGTPPTNDKVIGPYPTIITPDKSPEDRVLVVQDFTFSKYLGLLHVTFNDGGKITSYDGNPVLLDASVEQDPDVLSEINEFAKPITDFGKVVVGETYVRLIGNRATCRMRECNLGNLITDAMLESFVTYHGEESWSTVAISLMNGGGIRTTVDQGDITVSNIISVLPFQGTFDLFDLEGRYLLQALENSVSFYNASSRTGRFLQFSGLIVTYNVNRPVGDRVVSVEVRCAECAVPDYEPLVLNKTYRIVAASFIVEGGDGYTAISENLQNHQTGNLDTGAVADYIQKYSPIIQGIERRILFDDTQYADQGSATDSPGEEADTNGPGEENNITGMPPPRAIRKGALFGR